VTEPDWETWFTELYRAHRAPVYAYAVSRIGREHADEVVAETFLVAWRRCDAVPVAAPVPWLLGVARNVLRERYRADVRRAALDAQLRAWIGATGQTTADVAEGVIERATVLAALARLGDDDRELLTLIAWHGLGPAEAAQVVGCSTATLLVRLHRARKRFRQVLLAVESGGATRAALATRESNR